MNEDSEHLGKILIVDDEAKLAKLISMSFRSRGYQTWTAGTISAAEAILAETEIDLIILDISMPGESGLAFCRRFDSDIPIIMLSAHGATEERELGLEAGADDYLGKPFSMKELLLRVAALLRRAQQNVVENGVVLANGIELLPTVGKAKYRGRDLQLTPSEFRILWSLKDGKDKTSEELYEVMGSQLAVVGAKEAVRTAVYRLRAKLKKATGSETIETVRGLGYRLI